MKSIVNKIKIGLFVIYGLLMINGGLNKFFNYMPVLDDLPEATKSLMSAIETIGWLFPLVAVVEIIGGFLCLIPRTRALGALMLFPLVVGILLTHIFQDPATLPIAIIVFATNSWIMYDNLPKYLPLIK